MKTHPKRLVVALAAVAMLGLAACSAEETDAGNGSPNTTPTNPADSVFDPDLVAKAQEEGSVVFTSILQRADSELLAKKFKEQFGIDVTVIRGANGEVVQQIQSQIAAKAITTDVVVLADPSTMASWSADGVLGKVPLPNGDDFLPGFYHEEDGYYPIATQVVGIAYNPSVSEAPTSWAQVASGLDGKIAAANPSTSGTAAMAYAQVESVLGTDWLADVAANNDILTADSSGTIPQMVITGEVSYALPGFENLVLTAKAQGEPIDIAYLDEGVPSTLLQVGVLAEAAHPAAAQLLVQFAMQADAQSALASSSGLRSVLSTATAPDGASDLSSRTILTPATTDLDAQLAAVRDQWTELFS